MRYEFAAAALAFAFFVQPVLAQSSSGQPAQSDVVVTGQLPRGISAAAGGNDLLARWDRRICPGVAGLQATFAQLVADRLALRAMDIGLDSGEPGCRADILVLFTRDGDVLARDLVDNQRSVLGASAGGDREALEAFATQSRPVRWWQVTQTVSLNGQPINQPGALSRSVDVVRSQLSGGASRLQSTTRQDLSRMVIVVDATKTQSVPLDTLADYVAMVALAGVDPNANTSAFPSILNLFAPGGTPPSAMTDWDIAYLRSLYSIERNARTGQAQEGEIARRMNDGETPPSR